jgi:hypothetical protein
MLFLSAGSGVRRRSFAVPVRAAEEVPHYAGLLRGFALA